jgi:hypothetical protein
MTTDESKERMDHAHALIQRRRRVLSLVFEIVEKFSNDLRCDVFDRQVRWINSMTIGHKTGGGRGSHRDSCAAYCD